MSQNKSTTIGCFGIAGYFLFAVAILSYLSNLFQGEHLDHNGEWLSTEDMGYSAMLILGIGIVCVVVDKIRNK